MSDTTTVAARALRHFTSDDYGLDDWEVAGLLQTATDLEGVQDRLERYAAALTFIATEPDFDAVAVRRVARQALGLPT